MKRPAEQFRDQFMPWAGLAVGTVATGIAHQFGSEGMFDDCAAFSPFLLLVVAALAIVATALAALASWRVAGNPNEGPARRLVAIVSVGSAALLMLATLLPMIALLVVPRCYQ